VRFTALNSYPHQSNKHKHDEIWTTTTVGKNVNYQALKEKKYIMLLLKRNYLVYFDLESGGYSVQCVLQSLGIE
jgi:hypothetical protein